MAENLNETLFGLYLNMQS